MLYDPKIGWYEESVDRNIQNINTQLNTPFEHQQVTNAITKLIDAIRFLRRKNYGDVKIKSIVERALR